MHSEDRMETTIMKIIPYNDKYRQALIQMIKEVKIALGLKAEVREDLYDIQTSYLDRGDNFLIVLDDEAQIAGCLGYSIICDTDEAFLHRFYIRKDCKRQGIGSKLLAYTERELRQRGIRTIRVHLGAPREIWHASYAFYAKHGYVEYEPRYVKKEI